MKIRLWSTCLISALAVSLSFAADKPETVPLKLELPKPAKEGTPNDKPPDFKMEALSEKLRPDIQVPKGCENLALKKKVTSSDNAPIIGKLDMVTDGDKDAADYVEISGNPKWVQIDLAKSADIKAIIVWHCHKDWRVFKAVIVQVSDDPDFVKNVTTVFNSDQKNSFGMGLGTDLGYYETFQGKLIETKDVKGRYVRLYTKGSTADDDGLYTEVEVWGLPK